MKARHQTAVILHLFYTDLWDSVNSYLRNLEEGFDLYVTIPFDLIQDQAIIDNIKASYPESRIIRFENKGRDVAPFMEIYPAIAPLYKYICKIHTKRSLQIVDGTQWRIQLFDELLGSPERVREILMAFEQNPELGMIGPAGRAISIRSPKVPGFQAYRNILTPWADTLGIKKFHRLHYHYFGGTMFWFRSEAMLPILHLNITQAHFEEEIGLYEGTIAHALERFFPVAIHAAGFKITDTNDFSPETIGNLSPEYMQSFGEGDEAPARPRKWKHAENAEPGVNLIAPVEFVNGLGLSARGYAASLQQAGMPLNVIPWHIGFERVTRIAASYPTADHQPINIVHLNLDLLSSLGLDSPPLVSFIKPDCYNICIPYWELTALYPEWQSVIRQFDEFWCASSFIAKAISAVTSRHVKVVRPSLNWLESDHSADRIDIGLPEDKFIFAYAADFGSVLGRKNPMAFIRAYMEEFRPEEGACCLVKINYSNRGNPVIQELLSIAKQRPDVLFLDKLLTDEEMRILFSNIDCYVSPHRSEGLGLTILEAMSAAKPVIATPYGGVSDFVTADTAFPLDFQFVEVGEGNLPYPSSFIWADPSIASIRQRMRHVFLNREEAAEIGRRGRAHARSLFSVSETSAAIRREIARIWQDGSGEA